MHFRLLRALAVVTDIRMVRFLFQNKGKLWGAEGERVREGTMEGNPHTAYHFFDFSLGGGFLGMRNSALIGCMSQRAGERRRLYQ